MPLLERSSYNCKIRFPKTTKIIILMKFLYKLFSSPTRCLGSATFIGLMFYLFLPTGNYGESLTALFEGLISIQATVAFCAVIIAISAFAYGNFRKDTNDILDDINKFQKIVNGHSFDDWEDEVKQKGLQQPFEKIQKLLHASCDSVGSLLPQTNGTLKTMSQQRNGLVLLRSPREFINEDFIYYGRMNVPYYQSIPGALTGLGIFFTFVGLAAGVTLATQGLLPSQGDSVGIAPTNIGELLSSIGSLLEGAGQAFFTSICGLMTSLGFAFAMHQRENSIQQKIEELNRAIETTIPCLTPELIALINVDKVASQENMIREFKDGWDHLSDQFVDKLSGKLAENASEQTDALVLAINNLKDVTEKHLENTTTTINVQVTQAMAKFTEMLAESMEKMTESFDLSAKGVGQAVDDLEGALKTTNETMSNVTQTIELSLDQIMNRLQDIEARISQSSLELEQNLAKMSEHAQTMSTAVSAAGDKFQASTNEAADAWHQSVENAGQGFADQITQTGETFSNHLLESINQSSDTLTKSFESIAKDAEDFSGSLTAATEEQKALLNQYAEIRQALSDANQNLSSMLNECRATVELITSNHETFAKTIGALLKDTDESARNMVKTTTTSQDQLNTGLAQVIDMQRKVCETTDNLHELMTTGITNLANALTMMNDRIAENMSMMDRGLSEAIGSMSNGLEEWTELQDDVSSSLKKNSGEFQKAITQVAQFTKSVEESIKRLEAKQTATVVTKK